MDNELLTGTVKWFDDKASRGMVKTGDGKTFLFKQTQGRLFTAFGEKPTLDKNGSSIDERPKLKDSIVFLPNPSAPPSKKKKLLGAKRVKLWGFSTDHVRAAEEIDKRNQGYEDERLRCNPQFQVYRTCLIEGEVQPGTSWILYTGTQSEFLEKFPLYGYEDELATKYAEGRTIRITFGRETAHGFKPCMDCRKIPLPNSRDRTSMNLYAIDLMRLNLEVNGRRR